MQGLPDEAPSGQGLESRTEVLGGVESGGVRPCRKRSSDWGLGHELRIDHKSGWGLETCESSDFGTARASS